MKRLLAALALASVAATAGAHVGSPDVIFEGAAGPHHLRVTVRVPDVIPGLADVNVRLPDGGAAEIYVQPIWWRTREEASIPPPDRAAPVRGQAGLYSGTLWLMTQGSFAVRVKVVSAKGAGTVLVPVAATATRSVQMGPLFGAMLLALGGLLYGGAMSIAGAAAREAVVPVEDRPDRTRRRRGALAAAIAGLFAAGLVWGGWKWWGVEDARYRAHMYRPAEVEASVRTDRDGGVLRLGLSDDDIGRQRRGPLAPDHGKLMHLFLIREPALDVVAHLHPVPTPNPASFHGALPPLPAGSYRLYADVTYETGFAETLVDTVVVPPRSSEARPDAVSADPDDSWHESPPFAASGPATTEVRLGDGYVLVREETAAPVARESLALRFRIDDADGTAVVPEPYMGMAAHAVITRPDGSLFIHLHPSGTVSMAAQQVFAARQGSGGPADPHAAHGAAARVLSFPYEFPKAGRYRMWVQVKVAGVVRTGAFDLDVKPERS